MNGLNKCLEEKVNDDRHKMIVPFLLTERVREKERENDHRQLTSIKLKLIFYIFYDVLNSPNIFSTKKFCGLNLRIINCG